MELNQGALFEGRPGLSMLDDALAIAKKELNTVNLSVHPDFLLVKSPEGKKTLGVEQAGEMLSRCALRPAIAKRQVIVIDGIDRMTVAGQNKLLKMLEEEESILVLAVAYSADVLDTVGSRLSHIVYKPLNYTEFCAQVGDMEERKKHLLFHLTDGCPGLAGSMKDLITVCEDIIRAVEENQLKDLLPAMHLLTEKDKDSVATGQYKQQVIQFLEACFASELSGLYGSTDGFLMPNETYAVSQLILILNMLSEDKVICNRTTYSKDNFFNLIMRIITA